MVATNACKVARTCLLQFFPAKIDYWIYSWQPAWGNDHCFEEIAIIVANMWVAEELVFVLFMVTMWASYVLGRMDLTFILNKLQSLSLHEPFSSREIAGGPESLGMQAIAPRQDCHLL